jgi:hypothetical protein
LNGGSADAADQTQGEIELGAHVLGIVAGERERHERLRIDQGFRPAVRWGGFAVALVQLVRSLIEFGRDGFGQLQD